MHRSTLFVTTVVAFLAISACSSTQRRCAPELVYRSVEEIQQTVDGRLIEIVDHVHLFTPDNYSVPDDGFVFLTIHFHTAPWLAAEEHFRRGARNPLLIYSGFTGSSAYKEPFEDEDFFDRLLKEAAVCLASETGRSNIHVGEIEISSFSAGYGAVREILRDPRHVQRIRTILLADSLYAGYVDPADPKRRPVYGHIAPFVEFARLAVKGEKRFLITYSGVVPGTYASTEECARAIVEKIGGKIKPATRPVHRTLSQDSKYPLVGCYDRGGLHVWGYAGDDAKAHLAHVRALADFWTALSRTLDDTSRLIP